MNHLYYGDNLDVLKHHIKDETVDLVYLPEAAEQRELALIDEPDISPAVPAGEPSPDELKDLAHKKLVRSLGKKPARAAKGSARPKKR